MWNNLTSAILTSGKHETMQTLNVNLECKLSYPYYYYYILLLLLHNVTNTCCGVTVTSTNNAEIPSALAILIALKFDIV